MTRIAKSVILAVVAAMLFAPQAAIADPTPDAAPPYPYTAAQMAKAARSLTRFGTRDAEVRGKIVTGCKQTSPVTFDCLARFYLYHPDFGLMYGRTTLRDCEYNATIRKHKFYGFYSDLIAMKVTKKVPGGVFCRGQIVTSQDI